MQITDDIRQRIVELWNGPPPMSLTAIAERLGLTRGQVAGVMHRARLSGAAAQRKPAASTRGSVPRAAWAGAGMLQAPGGEVPATAKADQGATKIAELRRHGVPGFEPRLPPPASTAESPPDPPPQATTIQTERCVTERRADAAPFLRPVQPAIAQPLPRPKACLWPMWGHNERPTHRYCGKAVAPGWVPYCAEHRAIAIAKPKSAEVDAA